MWDPFILNVTEPPAPVDPTQSGKVQIFTKEFQYDFPVCFVTAHQMLPTVLVLINVPPDWVPITLLLVPKPILYGPHGL